VNEVAARTVWAYTVLLKVFAFLGLPAPVSHNRTKIFEAMPEYGSEELGLLQTARDKKKKDLRELAFRSIAAISW
jgi:hypothetical protein